MYNTNTIIPVNHMIKNMVFIPLTWKKYGKSLVYWWGVKDLRPFFWFWRPRAYYIAEHPMLVAMGAGFEPADPEGSPDFCQVGKFHSMLRVSPLAVSPLKVN